MFHFIRLFVSFSLRIFRAKITRFPVPGTVVNSAGVTSDLANLDRPEAAAAYLLALIMFL